MFEELGLDPAILVPLLLACAVAGVVRGFSGFGAGLIFMPVASALLDPRLAAVSFLIADAVITAPLIPPAVRRAEWGTVAPAAAAGLLGVPLGTLVLISADVTLLRWALSGLILVLLALLMSGWRYSGPPAWPASLAVGGMAGFLGGVAQVAGPPIVVYWMAGPYPAATIRANLITFFAIATLASATAYFLNGLFSTQSLVMALTIAPIYAVSVWLGARLFREGGERRFRALAYSIIALAAVTSLPILDSVLRG